MTDGAPKPKTPARSMATGCTIAVAIAVGVAGLSGYFLWKVFRGMDELAATGAAWLRMQPVIEREFGEVRGLQTLPKHDVRLEKGGDGGEAWFDYAVAGSKASGDARVWMVRRQGEWKPVAARLSVGGREVPIGEMPLYKEPPKTP